MWSAKWGYEIEYKVWSTDIISWRDVDREEFRHTAGLKRVGLVPTSSNWYPGYKPPFILVFSHEIIVMHFLPIPGDGVEVLFFCVRQHPNAATPVPLPREPEFLPLSAILTTYLLREVGVESYRVG